MLANQSFLLPSSEAFSCPDDNGFANPKRKRRPAGTPDPDAEVVYLSSEMLMESDRYVCEICKQSFQREQNLQMHRRRHKVPWKLLKRDKQEVNKKRVYVCPEPTCLHHDPSHALGDLVGIKKHFRRKHSNQKQFVCEKCSKGYAVQSDYKAHLKICGTKGHSCDCGRVFSGVETFIEHQDTCKARTTGAELQETMKLPCMSKLSSGISGNSNFTRNPLPDPSLLINTKPKPKPKPKPSSILQAQQHSDHHNLDLGLELFPSSNLSSPSSNKISPSFTTTEHNHGDDQDRNEVKQYYYSSDAWNSYFKESSIAHQEATIVASTLKNEASQLLRMAMEQKALAEKKRQEAKCLIELAKQDMTNAKKIREQVLALQDFSTNRKPTNNCRLIQVTCHACNTVFQTVAEEPPHAKAMTAHVVHVSSSSSSAMKDGAKVNEGFLLWPKGLASRS